MFPKTAIITGCSSFLGKNLVEYFTSVGWYVRGIDYQDTTYKHPNFTFIRLNLLNEEARNAIDLKGQVLIHAAGLKHAEGSDADSTIKIYNRDLASVAVDLCVDNQIPVLVNLSAYSVYGPQNGADLKEDMVLEPTSAYGMAKALAEETIDNRAAAEGIRAFSFRLFSPIGRHIDTASLVWQGLNAAAVGKYLVPLWGVTWRTYFNVEDLCRTVLYASTLDNTWRPGHYVFNLGGSTAYSQTRIFEHIKQLTSATVPYTYNVPNKEDLVRAVPDMSSTNLFLGEFISKDSMLDGLKAAILWYKNG